MSLHFLQDNSIGKVNIFELLFLIRMGSHWDIKDRQKKPLLSCSDYIKYPQNYAYDRNIRYYLLIKERLLKRAKSPTSPKMLLCFEYLNYGPVYFLGKKI